MNTAPRGQEHYSVEDYLGNEQRADSKHEYLAGRIFAMTGASDRHGLIAGALFAWLLPHARRKGCQLFIADIKVRIDHEGDSWFYYPDLLLSCDSADRDSPYYRRAPCLLVEVLSPSTESIDTREKLIAYRLLPRLREYLVLRQDRPQADLYQRTGAGHWKHSCVTLPDEPLPLACLDAQPSLRDIYADLPELLG